eukprot:m.543901 g.543901  ORF g.543901 m.543901 type:complete len:119 (-) comp57667_c0_seq97:1408-1764(-)
MLGHLLKLQASSHTIDTNTDDGEYPLVAAIAGGSIECLQLLVAAGTQMSTCLLGEEGSVLHVAAENSRTAMLLHLLQIDMFRAQVNSIGRVSFSSGLAPFCLSPPKSCQRMDWILLFV